MPAAKAASTLTLEDVLAHPVWRYKHEDALLPGEDESWVEPVNAGMVNDAYGHFFVATATLGDGSTETIVVGNTEPSDPEHTKLVQFFVFFRQGRQLRWNPMEHPAVAVAQFLGRELENVFPFSFNIGHYLVGHPEAVQRTVYPRGSASEA